MGNKWRVLMFPALALAGMLVLTADARAVTLILKFYNQDGSIITDAVKVTVVPMQDPQVGPALFGPKTYTGNGTAQTVTPGSGTDKVFVDHIATGPLKPYADKSLTVVCHLVNGGTVRIDGIKGNSANTWTLNIVIPADAESTRMAVSHAAKTATQDCSCSPPRRTLFRGRCRCH